MTLIILAMSLPNIIALLTTVIGFIFPFIWGKLKGYRVQIISFLQIIIGLMMMISDTIMPKLAELFHIETATVTGIIVAVMAFIQGILRLFTDTAAAPMAHLLKRMGMNKKEADADVQKLKR